MGNLPTEIEETVSSQDENQDTNQNIYDIGIDLEKTKVTLEFVLTTFTFISVISTAIIKMVNFGYYLCFSFDIGKSEFQLTSSDLITLFLCMSFTLFGFIYYLSTYGISCKYWIKYLNKNISQSQSLEYFFVIFILFFLYPCICLIILTLINYSNTIFTPIRNEIHMSFFYTYIFTILYHYYFVFYKFFRKYITKIVVLIPLISIILLFAVCSYLNIQNNYDQATNQKIFEIISAENDNGELQEYVVISKGSSYSAYRCSSNKKEESNGILTIFTNYHRFFSIDEYETQITEFDGYIIDDKPIPDVE